MAEKTIEQKIKALNPIDTGNTLKLRSVLLELYLGTFLNSPVDGKQYVIKNKQLVELEQSEGTALDGITSFNIDEEGTLRIIKNGVSYSYNGTTE